MSMKEADTRANLIDPKLVAVGWSDIESSFIRREFPITEGLIQSVGKRASSLSSDYVLEYRGRKLAAVEAKREGLSYTEGVAQAKDYAQRLQCRLGYATNGHDIYQIDMLTGEERLVDAFLSPGELWQLAWKLFQSRWSLQAQKNPSAAKKRPRVLFLADRNVLANQAFNDFGPSGEDAIVRIEPSEIRKLGAVPKNASVFFTIFQTFMSGRDEEGNEQPYFGDYPSDFFDFVIIDECHRCGANDESSWCDILNHFSPAEQLGLTATPKRTDNTGTYEYFGEPVYSYTLKEGVNDGFLTPFKVLTIVGTMDEYLHTAGDGVVIKGEPEAGRVYTEGEFNRIIIIPAREEKRVQEPCVCEDKPISEPCDVCGKRRCICEKDDPEPCADCG